MANSRIRKLYKIFQFLNISITIALLIQQGLDILGAGNIGALVASSLAGIPGSPPAVSLLLRSEERLREYNRYGSVITVQRPVNGTLVDVVRKIPATVGYHNHHHNNTNQHTHKSPESQVEPTTSSPPASQPISNLVVTVKMQQTVPAVASVIPAITPNTNILLLQNGMGSYELLCRTFWPDPAVRPKFLLGITSHGVKPAGGPEWKFQHVGLESIKLASVPSSSPVQAQGQSQESSNTELQDLFVQAGPSLSTEILSYSDFLLAQIEKLICNSVINPLTAIYDCFNGELLALESLDYLMFKLVSEASSVFTADLKRNHPDIPVAKIATALHPDRLNSLVIDIINRTSENKSSMLQDVQALRDSEIEYINGYIVQLAKQYGTGAIHNRMLLELIKGKLSLERDRERRSAPLINA